MNGRSTDFELLDNGLGAGASAPDGWHAVANSPLLIWVGLTGVGKTTTQEALRQEMAGIELLPNRRQLTDQLIIAHMQQIDGRTVEAVGDRLDRFAYTRRYRELYPGGMAHALSCLWVDGAIHAGQLLFDGLRGADEVGYAIDHLPKAFFIMLDAPDSVRVRRLLGRQDSFDQIGVELPSSRSATDDRFSALGLPEANTLFSEYEAAELFDLVDRGEVSSQDLQARLRIVLEERQNYDPAATRRTLFDHAPERHLLIDTTQDSAEDAAKAVAHLLQGEGPDKKKQPEQ
jgi:hypothetical protein